MKHYKRNRLPGYTPVGDIIGGQVVLKVDNDSIKANDGTTLIPVGFAIDTTTQFASAPAAGAPMVGSGHDYPNYARGGLVGVFTDGGLFQIYDDGRGNPLKTDDTWTLNAPVYAAANGKLTCSTTAGQIVGVVEAITGSGSTLAVTIKSKI